MSDIPYSVYIQSDEWLSKREYALVFWGHRCALCSSPEKVDVHHRTYERLGREVITDLIVLCDACHERHHERLSRANGPEHITSVLDRIAAKTGAGRVL